jgi:hypothetical protein
VDGHDGGSALTETSGYRPLADGEQHDSAGMVGQVPYHRPDLRIWSSRHDDERSPEAFHPKATRRGSEVETSEGLEHCKRVHRRLVRILLESRQLTACP